MTRRRALLVIFGALTVVFVLASLLTVALVRDQLLDAVDEDLDRSADGLAAAIEAFGIDFAAAIGAVGTAADGVGIETAENAIIIIDGRDEVLFVPAGQINEPLPRPDLNASTIVARAGEPFGVKSVDGEHRYRVLGTELPDGHHLAMAAPLDDVYDVLITLSRSLLITLFAVIAVLGVVFWWLLRASLRPYDAMIDTAHAIAEGDLGRRVETGTAEPALGQLSESLNTMLDRIQASFDGKEAAESRLRQFVADASHELRTPLTSISGYSELYLSGAATDEESTTQQMTRINHEAQRLTRLVNDLLTLARLDEQRPVERQPVDLARLAMDAATDFRAAAPDHPLSLDARPGAVVDGDGDALRQVIVNLLANVHHHTPAGTQVALTVETDGEGVAVSVADDGPGMADDTARHVFDRFYRADKSRARATGNSGLGLAIAAAIVDAHGGTIDLETAPGTGTTFTVRLPRSLGIRERAGASS